MRNKYPGTCYRCLQTVTVGAGHFERIPNGWRVIHASCVFDQRGEKRQITKHTAQKPVSR